MIRTSQALDHVQGVFTILCIAVGQEEERAWHRGIEGIKKMVNAAIERCGRWACQTCDRCPTVVWGSSNTAVSQHRCLHPKPGVEKPMLQREYLPAGASILDLPVAVARAGLYLALDTKENSTTYRTTAPRARMHAFVTFRQP